MAADGYGTKGEPEFDDGGAPDTAVDPTLVGQYAGLVGNRLVGTSTQRAAFAAIWTGFTAGPWNGLEFEETDTTIVYKRIGGSWRAWDSDWISYTPTFTNLAVGTGGSAASSWAYKYATGNVVLRGGLTLGSSGQSVSGIPVMTLPVNRAALLIPYELMAGAVSFYDLSDTRPWLVSLAAENTSVSQVRFLPINSGSVTTAISSTIPFTWAAGDSISVFVTYRPA